MHVSVLVPEPPVMLVALSEQVSPVAVEMLVVRATVDWRYADRGHCTYAWSGVDGGWAGGYCEVYHADGYCLGCVRV